MSQGDRAAHRPQLEETKILIIAVQQVTLYTTLHKERPRRGGGRPFSKPSGMNDPYGIDFAPMNIFETQIIPIRVHNLSKSFRPNMATIRVISLGTKFISNWRDYNLKHMFRNLVISKEDFKTTCFSWKQPLEVFV